SKKASEYLNNFARLMRLILQNSRSNYISLKDELEALELYLQMESLRFNNKFNYSIHVDNTLDQSSTLIPPMLIQPYVENAIWHGLMHVEGPKNISIDFTQEQQRITCTIEDNGIGIRESEKLKVSHRSRHKSVGLENLYNRIKILNEKYDTDCSLEVTDLHQNGNGKKGTLVVLSFNIVNL
ncbi:MAG TPA: histidine kinase, partial [Chitinophagaceae bacterium]|nr:histidine kinase [Chitinophagaceae bacterium]